MPCQFRVTWEERIGTANRSHLNDSSTASENEKIKGDRNVFLYVYAGIMVFGIASFMFRSFSFYHMCLRLSINLHDMMFRGVTRAKMIFFCNKDASGRILNRFARDISNVDSTLPHVMFDLINVRSIFNYFPCENKMTGRRLSDGYFGT